MPEVTITYFVWINGQLKEFISIVDECAVSGSIVEDGKEIAKLAEGKLVQIQIQIDSY